MRLYYKRIVVFKFFQIEGKKRTNSCAAAHELRELKTDMKIMRLKFGN